MTKPLSFLKATLDELLWTCGMLLANAFVALSWILEYMTAAVSALHIHLEMRPSSMTFSENGGE